MTEDQLPPWAKEWGAATGGTLDEDDTELLDLIDKAGPGFARTPARIEKARVQGPAGAPELVLLFSHPDRVGERLGYRWPLGKGGPMGDYGFDILVADFGEMADRANDDRVMEAEQGPDGIAWVNGPDEDIDYWETHPDPSDEDIEELCRAWIRYQQTPRTPPDPDAPITVVRETSEWALEASKRSADEDDGPDWWAVDAVLMLSLGGQFELFWRVIRCLCATVDPADDSTVGMIGASPLENFISLYRDRAMDLIEPAADSDPVLLAALASVWIDEPIRSRLDRYLTARGSGYGTGAG